MTTARWTSMGVCALAGWLLLTGCGPGAKDLQIQALNEEIASLRGENDGLRSQLASAARDSQECRSRLYQLQQDNSDLRAQLRDAMSTERPTQSPNGWTEANGFAWIDLDTDLLFDSGRATLKGAAQQTLARIVSDIQGRYPDKSIWVIGHTDNDPIRKTKNLWHDNLDLSVNRAMTVFHELEKMGIAPQRLIAAGRGEYAPKASNSSNQGKALNRRVQIVAVPMPEGPALIEAPSAPASSGAVETPPAVTIEK